MFVNTNSSSLRAQSMLFESSQAASTAMERLATGSKINSVQDDVAGSAIADRMTSQVRGLNMAVKNVNDAMAMLSVADSAASDITDMLQRMRELAIQAASDTNSAAERQYLQDEVDDLEGKAEAFRQNGWLYARNKEYITAEESLNDALIIYKDLNNKEKEANIYRNIGDLYNRTMPLSEVNLSKGVEFFQKAKSIRTETEDFKNLAADYFNLARG